MKELRNFVAIERGLKDESIQSKITKFGFDFTEKTLNEQKRNI